MYILVEMLVDITDIDKTKLLQNKLLQNILSLFNMEVSTCAGALLK